MAQRCQRSKEQVERLGHPSEAYCALQVDNRHQPQPVITAEQAVRLCDRNFGVGGDGVRPASKIPFDAWMCGGRCLPVPDARQA